MRSCGRSERTVGINGRLGGVGRLRRITLLGRVALLRGVSLLRRIALLRGVTLLRRVALLTLLGRVTLLSLLRVWLVSNVSKPANLITLSLALLVALSFAALIPTAQENR